MEEPKITKPRLRSVKAMMAETLRQLDEIAADATQKPAKRSDAVMTKANLLQSLYQTQSEEARARLKHADVGKLHADLEAARAEIARLNAELNGKAPVTPKTDGLTFEERIAQL